MTPLTLYSASSPPRYYVWLAWLVFTLLWFGTLGHNSLISPDEGRYASIALEMLHSGDWLTPRLNGLLYFEKPALPYWIGALSFKLLGVNEFSARLWPALSGFLAIITVGSTARRLWGEEAGHLAALVLASSSWMIANGHFLNLDMGLTFFLTLCLCAFLRAQCDDAGNSSRLGWMWVCWASMAGATLSKGLIGILIPGSVLILYSLIYRQFAFWRRLHLISGLLIFFLLAAPWFILVSLKNPGFFDFFFIYEHFERFISPSHQRTGPFWYFVPVLLLGFLPWTSLLPQLLHFGIEREGRSSLQSNRLLLIWTVFVFLFFSKSESKLTSYILPMFPALALLAGHYLSHCRADTLRKHLIVPTLFWLTLLGLYPFANRFSGDTPLPVIHHFAGYIAIAALLFLLGAACAWRFLVLERKLGGICLLALASLAAQMLMTQGYDRYAELKGSRAIAAQLHPSAATELFSVRCYEQTLPFYFRRNVTLVDYVDEFHLGETLEPKRWIPTLDGFVLRWQAAPSALAFMHTDTYEELQQRGLAMRVVFQDSTHLVVGKP